MIIPNLRSSSWSSFSLSLGLTSGVGNANIFLAVGLALRCHTPVGRLTFDTLEDATQGRRKFLVAESNEIGDMSTMLKPCPDTDPANIVVFPTKLASPKSIAVEHLIPTLVYLERGVEGTTLHCLRCNVGLRESEASWLLIHVARVLQHLSAHGHPPSPPSLHSGTLDLFVFRGVPEGERYPISCLQALARLHDTVPTALRACTRLNPLGTAISLYTSEGQLLQTVSYGAMLALSLRIAYQIRTTYTQPTNLALMHHDNPVATICGTLAILIAGHCYVAVASGITPMPEGSVLLDITQYAAPALLKNPGQLLYQDWLPSVEATSQLIQPTVLSTPQAMVVQPCISDTTNPAWEAISHETLGKMLRRRFWWFEGYNSTVLLPGSSLDYPRFIFMMETFFHGMALQCVHRFETLSFHLAKTIRPTHIVVDAAQWANLAHSLKICKSPGSDGDDFLRHTSHILLAYEPTPEERARDFGCFENPDVFVTLILYNHEEKYEEKIQMRPASPPETVKVIYQKFGCRVTPESVLHQISEAESLTKYGARAVKLKDGLLVKFSPFTRTEEVRNALFAREHTTIPIPDVHLMFSYGTTRYMVVDYIPSRTLQESWGDLTHTQRKSALAQLKDYFAQLRAIAPAPDQAPGPVGGGRCIGLYFPESGVKAFATNADLVAWQNHMLALSGHTKFYDAFVETPLVFTHQDIAPWNLLLDENDKLWLIDWDRAGWYPEYFESLVMLESIGIPDCRPPPNWFFMMRSIVPDYTKQQRQLAATRIAVDGYDIHVMAGRCSY